MAVITRLRAKPLLEILLLVLLVQCHVTECIPAGDATTETSVETTTKKSGSFFGGFKKLFGGGKSTTTTEVPLLMSSTTAKAVIASSTTPKAVPLPSVPFGAGVTPKTNPSNGPSNPWLGLSEPGMQMPGKTPSTAKPTSSNPWIGFNQPATTPKQVPVTVSSTTPKTVVSTLVTTPKTGVSSVFIPITTPKAAVVVPTTPKPPVQSPVTTPKAIPSAVPIPSVPSSTPKPLSIPLAQPTTTSTTKAPKIKEDFPSLPTPKKPYVKEDFPALPSKAGSTPPPAWSTQKPAADPFPALTTPRTPTTTQKSRSLATDEELATLSETLFQKETSSQLKYVSLNLQGKTMSSATTDEAPNPLFTVQSQAWDAPTIAKMRVMYNNYELDTSINEYVTPIERKEENEFLDLVMATPVMRQTMTFLQGKGLVTADPKTHRDLVKSLWFNMYSRGNGKISSSGFEHVFLSEVKDGKVIGLHNWVYAADEEKEGHLDYKGYMKKVDLGNKATIVKFRSTHNGLNKPVNAILVGTSPELELAMYTLCFEVRPDGECPMTMGGKKFAVQTHTYRYRGKTLIGSAYVSI